MKTGRKRIGGFWASVLISVLFMAGVISLTWILARKIMGLPLGRTTDFLHNGGLEELTLSEDGFYEISSPEDFRRFWEEVSGGGCAVKGRLLCDIYLNASADLEEWSGQAPEYLCGKADNFYGIFDGGGHTVYGLYSKNGYGLVKYNHGIIRNLVIENSLVRGAVYSGGLCYANTRGASIENCRFYGNVVSSYVSAPVRMSGISVLNEGRIERCGYAGEMYLRNNRANICDMAGICLRNDGVVKDCYNFSRQAAERNDGGLSLAISDGGEKNCYMLRDSGWDPSQEGQVLTLDEGQSIYIEDYLNQDLAALLGREEPLWARQLRGMNEGLSGRLTKWPAVTGARDGQRKESIDKDTLRLSAALRDKVVCGVVFDILHAKRGEIGGFSFEKRERQGAKFGLCLNYSEESFLLYAYPYEGRHSMEELWEEAGTILFGKAQQDWEHDTFALLPKSAPGETEERILLYRLGDGQQGFFYSDEEKLYQFIPGQGEGAERGIDEWKEYLQSISLKEDAQDRDPAVKEEESLTGEETLLWQAFCGVCSEKIPWDGILWKDEGVKSAVYRELSESGAGTFSRERVTGLDSLAVSPEHTLSDLGMFSNLTNLYVEDFEGGNLEEELSALPLSGLTQLGLTRCGVKDISFLKGMPLLEEVGLLFNRIEDISPVKGLKHLRRLNLTGNQVRDLSPLAGAGQLQEIGLAQNQISDITPLRSLRRLKNLSLSQNKISDIDALGDMKEMEYLGLSGNQIQDFAPIFGMEKLFFLEVSGNPSQDIGELYLVPDLMIGREGAQKEWGAERKWAAELLNSRKSGTGLVAEDLAWGDINGDGLSDVAVTGYGGEERDEEGNISGWGTRQVFLFLGTEQGGYVFADAVETLGPNQGGAYGDPYMGTAISGGRLVIQCYGGSYFRWTDTRIYEYEKERLVPVYELSLDNYVFTSGSDWQVEDFREGIVRKYAFAGEWESHMEKLLLLEEKSADGGDAERMAASWRPDALPPESPEIEEWIYRPEIDDGYYTYEIHDPGFATKRKPSEVLERAARTYLADLVEFSIPIYASLEIKNSFDLLSGIELPDCFYSGKGQTGEGAGPDVELLTYEMCYAEENGNYVHVMRALRPNEDRTGWQICAYILYREETDDFEVVCW